jgi:uncharacterized heparinase superfamily protein
MSARLVDWHRDPVHERSAPMAPWPSVPFLDPSCGDHKIIWELNRHQHWLALGRAFWLTGTERYRTRGLDELADWMDANPPLVGINWASMLELALRSLSWLWALNLFVDESVPDESIGAPSSRPWTLDLLVGFDLQLAHVERHLSRYFSPNTHLLGEALALYVGGLCLPELAASARRADTGRRVLLAEITRQIGSDGGHLERSTHYHRYTLDFYLLASIVARINGDPAAAQFEDAASRLATAARLLADDRGRIPHIGDDDGGMLLPMAGRRCDDLRDSLAVAATLLDRPELRIGRIPEEARWLLAHPRFDAQLAAATASPAGHAPVASTALEETGYYVSRTPASDHLVIDGGPHGYMNAGHAHADALSLTFSVRGLPLLIDTGTGCYTTDAPLRDRFRSTALHNTITLDGRSSSVASGPFHWSQVADSRVRRWRTGPGFDYFDGLHEGYGTVAHRRCVLALHGDLLIVVDNVSGSGTHAAAAHWHVDPGWSAQRRGRQVSLSHRGHSVTFTAPGGAIELFTADREAGLGWHAPAYGRIEAATTVRLTCAGELPLRLVSVFGLSAANPVCDVSLLPDDAPADSNPMAAIRIRRATSDDYVLIATADDMSHDASGLARVGDLETDAAMLFFRMAGSRTVSRLAFADGSIVRTVNGSGLRLEMPRRTPHYFADFAAAPRRPPRRAPQEREDTPCAASPAS